LWDFLCVADFGATMSTRFRITIEDWDGDGAIRIPDQALQELGVDVGDSLYLIEEFVGTTRCLVLSKTQKIPDRVDELFGV
jgi:antitoxin component of MazEF toxin-antitoxin module